MSNDVISADEARRIAIAAQGLADRRPVGRIDRRHLRKVMEQIGLIQIDSVNVLVRSQELPLFARLGPHPRSLIADATAAGELFEYWVHEASHVPTEHYHLHRWKMEQPHRWSGVASVIARRPELLDEVLARVAAGGPVASGDFNARVGPKGTWWDWDDAKVALEQLFWSGKLTARRRPNDFARLYELTERWIPAAALDHPVLSERDARKELLLLAARHHGIATLNDLTDYHRQRNAPCKPLLAELVEEGKLLPVTVKGWKAPAYLHAQARRPRRVAARALLSPFDSLVFNRERTERVFAFNYRIEIYTPPPKRIYGYYVLPFLLGDELVGRIDLKSERATGTLLVQGSYAEPGVPDEIIVPELADELRLMAGWLGLTSIRVMPRGDLAVALKKEIG
ncbi:MAG TPA: crosslink repair DNA glycosylase YcaQ family protein [Ilumatobacteraceae bacterium]